MGIKMNNQDPNCELLGPLLSAMLDGELDSSERAELLVHLNRCPECRAQVRDFEQVNLAVDSLSHQTTRIEPVLTTLPGSSEIASLSKTKPATNLRRVKTAWRLIPLTAAAALVICLGIAAMPDQGSASAEQIPPEQFVEPMKEFLASNYQRQHDQDLMLRTLNWDLRTLKLELNHLAADSEERIALESQIDAMIAKVQQFETDTSLASVEE